MLYHSAIDAEGNARWPDAYQTSEEYYAIDCGPYLLNENDTLTGVLWTVPAGLTELDAQTIDNVAHIKLRADTIGDHLIGFELNSDEFGNTQKTLERMHLRVT